MGSKTVLSTLAQVFPELYGLDVLAIDGATGSTADNPVQNPDGTAPIEKSSSYDQQRATINTKASSLCLSNSSKNPSDQWKHLNLNQNIPVSPGNSSPLAGRQPSNPNTAIITNCPKCQVTILWNCCLWWPYSSVWKLESWHKQSFCVSNPFQLFLGQQSSLFSAVQCGCGCCYKLWDICDFSGWEGSSLGGRDTFKRGYRWITIRHLQQTGNAMGEFTAGAIIIWCQLAITCFFWRSQIELPVRKTGSCFCPCCRMSPVHSCLRISNALPSVRE